LPVAQAAADAGVKHVVYPGAAKVEGFDFPLFDALAQRVVLTLSDAFVAR
jgi:hypothetical protein